jgi:hypothetical protein
MCRCCIDVFGTKRAQVPEYWIDASRFSNWKRPAARLPYHPEVIGKDIDYYRLRGFDSITSFACYYDADYVARNGKPPIQEYGAILASIE